MKDYKLTTFGDYCKDIDLTNKTFVFCENCKAMVLDDRNLKLVDIKDCPKCGKPITK